MTTENAPITTCNSHTSFWLSIYGVILILGGILCCVLPLAGGIGVEIVITVSLLFAGGLHLTIASTTVEPAKAGYIFAGVIELLFALLILTHPMIGLFAVTIYIGVALILQGVSTMFLIRRLGDITHHFFWFISTIFGIAVGVFIVFSFKSTAIWLPGTLVGISFVITGIATLLIGRSLKIPV